MIGGEIVDANCGHALAGACSFCWHSVSKAVADRDARIAELEKALSVCERAIKALLVMMDRGDRPSKLDEALTWTQNDNLAKSLGRNAVEEIRKALGKGEL